MTKNRPAGRRRFKHVRAAIATPADFDDTPGTATGDSDTGPEAGDRVARLPQPLPMDEVDEWDPFGEPDIA